MQVTTWWSGCCYLNKRECDSNQSKVDSFVERVAKNNSWNNGDRHKLYEIFLINCFVPVKTLVWQIVHSWAMTQITADLMKKTLQTSCSVVACLALGRLTSTCFGQHAILKIFSFRSPSKLELEHLQCHELVPLPFLRDTYLLKARFVTSQAWSRFKQPDCVIILFSECSIHLPLLVHIRSDVSCVNIIVIAFFYFSAHHASWCTLQNPYLVWYSSHFQLDVGHLAPHSYRDQSWSQAQPFHSKGIADQNTRICWSGLRELLQVSCL